MIKNIYKILICSTILVGIVGCGNQPMTGQFEVAENESVEVRDENGNLTALKPGPSSVLLADSGLMSSNRTLTLENEGKKTKIRIPDSAFLSATDFAVNAHQINQEFDLKAVQQRQWTGPSRLENGRVSCTYMGYCLGCGLSISGGGYECGKFSYKFDCSGTQPALLSKRDYRDITSILFYKNNQQIGQFTSDSVVNTVSSIVERSGSCH